MHQWTSGGYRIDDEDRWFASLRLSQDRPSYGSEHHFLQGHAAHSLGRVQYHVAWNRGTPEARREAIKKAQAQLFRVIAHWPRYHVQIGPDPAEFDTVEAHLLLGPADTVMFTRPGHEDQMMSAYDLAEAVAVNPRADPLTRDWSFQYFTGHGRQVDLGSQSVVAVMEIEGWDKILDGASFSRQILNDDSSQHYDPVQGWDSHARFIRRPVGNDNEIVLAQAHHHVHELHDVNGIKRARLVHVGDLVAPTLPEGSTETAMNTLLHWETVVNDGFTPSAWHDVELMGWGLSPHEVAVPDAFALYPEGFGPEHPNHPDHVPPPAEE